MKVKALAVLVCSFFMVAAASVALLAHQQTFKGTVLAVAGTSVEVTVVDPKTKKTEPQTFKTDAETKVLRGDAVVTFANAKIRKGENISITVDHDLDISLALVIRLDAAK
jgi:hypothetical protein